MSNPSPTPSLNLRGDGLGFSSSVEFFVGDGVWPKDVKYAPEVSVLEDVKLVTDGFGHLPKF